MKTPQVLGLGIIVVALLSTEKGGELVKSFQTTEVENLDTIVAEPTEKIKNLVAPLKQPLQQTAKKKVQELRDFYLIFADIVERDQAFVIKDSAKFRKYNEITLRLAFKDAYDSTPGLVDTIEIILQTIIPLSPGAKLEYKDVAEVLRGISWQSEKSLKQPSPNLI